MGIRPENLSESNKLSRIKLLVGFAEWPVDELQLVCPSAKLIENKLSENDIQRFPGESKDEKFDTTTLSEIRQGAEKAHTLLRSPSFRFLRTPLSPSFTSLHFTSLHSASLGFTRLDFVKGGSPVPTQARVAQAGRGFRFSDAACE